jgi:HD-GYP domain-containing protein (c-di-GMP phosphodiesterase class II)
MFVDKSHYKRVPVSALKLGMFVAELDRPWLETPFLLQGLTIHTLSELRKLREYCKYVYIDEGGKDWGAKKNPFNAGFKVAKRSLTGDAEGTNSRAYRSTDKKPTPTSVVRLNQPEHKVQHAVEEEHPVAKRVYRAAHNTVSGLLEQARLGNALDTDSAKEVVTDCVDSILRNPSALMWMAKIKHVDYYTMEHSLNVCVLAIAFGRHLRMDKIDLVRLGTGGMLHDVGKMQIPDEVLNKPAKLTDEEFSVMSQHPEIGRRLLMKSQGSLSYAVDVAFNHHERMDGKGYPRGLFARELSEYSRIISIVDAFDAMTSDRCYAKARSTLDALKIIYKERGVHFDEEYALEFIQLMGPYPPGTIVELVNGAVGIVLSSEEKKRHLPKIKLVLDQEKRPQPEEIVNLLNVDAGNLGKDWLIRKVLKDGDHDLYLEQYPVRRALAGMETMKDI